MAFERAQRAFIHQVALRRHTAPVRLAARAARALLRAQGNWSYDHEVNGERRVLEVLGRFRPGCVFDVGANVGDWMRLAHRLLPGAAIHAFEIVPDVAEALERAARELPGVTANAFGLGDTTGTVEVRFFPGASQLSGIDPLPHGGPSETRVARVTTGDDYCAEHAIGRVDLLKVDVEGSERAVLDGFGRMFRERRIDAVQFEYGLVNVRSHFLLHDFHAFFESAGFEVGKVFPDAVEFRPYDLARDEDFLGPNYLAVRAERTDLIEALRGDAR